MATMETELSTTHPLISFRSILAGLLIAFFAMAGLLGVGMAFGGIGLSDGSSIRAAGIFSGVWFTVSALISIFVGSYFAARVSKFKTARIGSAQGLVIASLFLGFFLYQVFAAIGNVGSMAGNMIGKTAGAVGGGIANVTENPALTQGISNMTEDAIGNLNLRSSPGEVASGLVSRLVQGDVESAQNFLAREANINPNEASARVEALQTRVNETLVNAREGAASALRSTGLSLFLLVLFGAAAAIGGGSWGSSVNLRKPIQREEYTGHGLHA